MLPSDTTTYITSRHATINWTVENLACIYMNFDVIFVINSYKKFMTWRFNF
jgi:hypothetical protein